MIEFSAVLLPLLAGLVLGTIFFGGLWWTIQRGVSSKNPAILFAGSLLVRTVATLAGFYFASRGDWRRLMTCLLGFIVARILITRLTRGAIAERAEIVAAGGR